MDVILYICDMEHSGMMIDKRKYDIGNKQSVIVNMNNKKDISEFADSRKDYVAEARNQRYNIFEHLMLLIWCRYNDKNNRDIQHWKSELAAFCKKLSLTKLKKGDEETKEKILVEQLLVKPDMVAFDDVVRNFDGLMTYHYDENHDMVVSKEMFDFYTYVSTELIGAMAKSDARQVRQIINSII